MNNLESDKNSNFEQIPNELKLSVEEPAKKAVKTLRLSVSELVVYHLTFNNEKYIIMRLFDRKRCLTKSQELKDKAQGLKDDVKTRLEEKLAAIQGNC